MRASKKLSLALLSVSVLGGFSIAPSEAQCCIYKYQALTTAPVVTTTRVLVQPLVIPTTTNVERVLIQPMVMPRVITRSVIAQPVENRSVLTRPMVITNKKIEVEVDDDEIEIDIDD